MTDTADYIEAEFGQDRADRFQEDIKKGMETRSPCSKGIVGGTQLAEYIEKDKELYLSNITFMQEDSEKSW